MAKDKKVGFYLEDMQLEEFAFNNEELFLKLEQTNSEDKPEVVEEIMMQNLRLLHFFLRKRYPNLDTMCRELRITRDEVFSAGTLGLMKAINTYNVHSGYKFATYMNMVVNNEFGQFMRKHKRLYGSISLQEETIHDGDSELSLMDSLMDSIDIEDEVVHEQFGYMIMEEIEGSLDEREIAILKMSIQGDMTQREIGEALGISRTYVNRLYHKAVNKARAVYDTRVG